MKSGPAALVLALGKKSKGEDDETDADAYSDDEKEEAGTALADALKGGDGMAIYDAFEALKRLCEEG